MPKQKSRKQPGARMGRPPLSVYGLAARTRRVLAAFTPDEYAQLELDAEREGVTVAELVAQRALGRL